jgi:hypothetical protein
VTEYAVVMTACIDPSKGRVKVQRADPDLRLRDYRDGLRFWLGLTDRRIDSVVFIDNSGYPLGLLMEDAQRINVNNKQLEFISLDSNTYPEGTHYGHAELGMLDHALLQSQLLRRHRKFIKATGRLAFPGISRLLDRLPPDLKVAVDGRSRALFWQPQNTYITTQLMVFATDFYRNNLLHANSELGVGESHIEKLMLHKLLPMRNEPGVILRWPVNVNIRGVAAHWQKNYDSPKQRVINSFRAVSRILAPNWWV